MKKQSGFTLIELMVVMAIIAILATAGLSAYVGYLKKGRDTARVSIANQVNTAVNALMGSNGGVPPTDDELLTELASMNMTAAIETLEVGSPTYLSSVSSLVESIGDIVGIPSLFAAIREPSGGKAICLGYDSSGNITQGESCAFRYIVYGDNTYVIGYGVEHESSLQKNFYKIATAESGGAPKYMQVVGTAEYVGLPSIGETGGPAPTAATPFGASKITITDGVVDQPDVSSEIDTDKSAPLSDETTGDDGGDEGGGGGGGVGSPCGQNQDCDGNSYCSTDGTNVCMAGTIQIGDSCSDAGTCASGLWCVNDLSNWTQTCSSSPLFGKCRNDAECGDGLICTTFNGCSDKALQSPCATNADCNSEYCYEGSAGDIGGYHPYTCTDGSAGVGCGSDMNCQGGLTCVVTPGEYGGVCTSGGGECSVPEDCASNSCGGDPKVCRETGSVELGNGCGFQNECVTGYCDFVNYICTTGETGTDGCYDGDNCQSGYCNAKDRLCSTGESGQTCDSNTYWITHQCISGNCTNDICD